MSCRSCHDSYQPEIDRLRAELDETQQALTSEAGWRCKYEAASARVRALILEDGGDAFFEASEISRALDGGTE